VKQEGLGNGTRGGGAQALKLIKRLKLEIVFWEKKHVIDLFASRE